MARRPVVLRTRRPVPYTCACADLAGFESGWFRVQGSAAREGVSLTASESAIACANHINS